MEQLSGPVNRLRAQSEPPSFKGIFIARMVTWVKIDLHRVPHENQRFRERGLAGDLDRLQHPLLYLVELDYPGRAVHPGVNLKEIVRGVAHALLVELHLNRDGAGVVLNLEILRHRPVIRVVRLENSFG